MRKQSEESRRNRVGYGSSYRKGTTQDLRTKSEIGTVLGGQVWMVKPDKRPETEHPCLWMQAGVVEFKNCNNFYDCTRCKYDIGMRRQVGKGKLISWQDAMRKRSGLDRICRHSLTNRIEARVCGYNYECSKCDFDQFFEDIATPKTASSIAEVQHIRGFDVPSDCYFHNGHTWARIESGGYVRVGMDDFAMKLLGSPDAFDLPLMGKELDQDEIGWGLERKGNLADVRSPVGGVILEVNSKIRENSQLASAAPFEEGWLFTLRTPDIKGTVKKLMGDTQSLDWMNGEVTRLEQMIEQVGGPLATDGGHLAGDIYGNFPDLGWKNLTKTFLKT